MSRSSLSLFLVAALVGCDDAPYADKGADSACPPAFSEDDSGACFFDEAAVEEIMRTFEDTLVKVNALEFGQITDPDVIRNVYITPLPVIPGLGIVQLYRSMDPDFTDHELPASFPVGTVIVHERVDGVEGNTVQVKRESGYESEVGGRWWFGKYFEDGTPDVDPCSPCVACHNSDVRPVTEGLWGVPRDSL